jgi:hypothetical protein
LTLLWKKEYIGRILSGEKTATRRRSRPMVRVGGSYLIRDGFFTHRDERITVNRLYTQRLGEMTEEDAEREGAPSREAFVGEWTRLYGSFDPGESVWVVEFRLAGAL